MGFDRKYLVWSLSYAVVGMCLGIFMAASHDHGQYVTHAHILLVGFVASLVYAVIHRLWLEEGAAPVLARIQFIIHQAGAVAMFAGLFAFYGRFAAPERLDPILAIASVAVLLGAALMLFMVATQTTSRARTARAR